MTEMKHLPYLENYPTLRGWLDKHNARCLWQTTTDQKPASVTNSMVEYWALGSAVCIIVVHPSSAGWDLFTPGADVDANATLADAEKRLGL